MCERGAPNESHGSEAIAPCMARCVNVSLDGPSSDDASFRVWRGVQVLVIFVCGVLATTVSTTAPRFTVLYTCTATCKPQTVDTPPCASHV